MNPNTAQNPNTIETGTGGRMGAEKEPGVAGAGTGTGTGAMESTGGVGGKIKSAYHVIHGLGDNVRGTALGAIDTATHKGGTENDEIARRGRLEMEQGLAAFRQPKSDAGVGGASAGHAGGVTGGGPGTGTTAGGAAPPLPGRGNGPQTAETLPSTQQNNREGAGGTNYNVAPVHGDATQTHPGTASTTTAGQAGTGAGAALGGVSAASTTGDRNGGYGPQNPATGGFHQPDTFHETRDQPGMGDTGKYPPGSQDHLGGLGNGGNREQTSGYHSGFGGTGVDSQNQNQDHGGYGQTEKHTTEQFASRATSVPYRGPTQINDQRTVEGGADANNGGVLAHHHRDDAVTNLNAPPGEKHGDGQLSTAAAARVPEYDRNEAFKTHQGGGAGVQGEKLGGLHQGGPAQGYEGNRGGMPGAFGGDEGEGYHQMLAG